MSDYVKVGVVVENNVINHGIASIISRAVDTVIAAPYYDPRAEMESFADCDLLIFWLRELEDTALEEVIHQARGIHSKVLLAFNSSCAEDFERVVQIHADGFIDVNSFSESDAGYFVKQVLAGRTPVPDSISRGLLHYIRGERGNDSSRYFELLTPQENEVLKLIVDGESNKEISRRLGMSSHNVKRLVANVLAKLNCPNRTSAAALALREGIFV